MMLAQTNLQLYRQLIEAGWDEPSLLLARRAYELACELVGNSYRPNGKAFASHLLGTASALVHWNERPAMVLAGLLHSAYLYGDFGDGERRDSPRRRAYLQSLVGTEVEELICKFMNDRSIGLFETTDRDLRVLKLANLLDELTDAGTEFAAGKPVPEIDGKNEKQRYSDLITLAHDSAGSAADQMFQQTLSELQSIIVPACLKCNQRASRPVQPGVAALRRSRLRRRVAKLQSKIAARRAA